MRSVLKVFLVLALGAFAGLAQADPPGRVARLNHVVGTVSFAPGEAPDQWGQAVINRPLTGGDRLWADRDGRGEFHVGSTAVRIGHVTNVDVLYLDDDRLQLRLGQGAVNVRVREMDADDLVEIATPAGAVLIRQPGSYRVTADPHTHDVRVVVNFGQAELVTPVRSVLIPSGQAAVVDSGGQPAFEVAAYGPTDGLDRWSAERDRSEDRIASTRYVSSHMTGYEDLDRHGTWQTLPEYGAVWTPARVAPDWAPYRHGHWAWVSPWGWTWVDDAPWGFAPFHYGRWVHVHDRWAWAPGPIVRRPVYAPALVAFVGGAGFSFSARSGPAVGWFPLGWREPYRPWYRASPTHVRSVNVTHVTNVTNVNIYRNRPDAVTVVPQQTFVSARPVGRSRFNVAQADLARAQVIQTTPAEPVRTSIAPELAGQRPPARAATREVVAVTPPAATNARDLPGRDRAAADVTRRDEPRVRFLAREGIEGRRGERQREAERERAAPQAAPAQPASSGPAIVAPAAPAPAATPPAPIRQAAPAPPASNGPAVIAPAAPAPAAIPPAPIRQAAPAQPASSGPAVVAPAAPVPAATAPVSVRQAAPAPAASNAAAPAPPAAARERHDAPRVLTEPQRPRADAPRERGEARREGAEPPRERFERRREFALERPQPERPREARQEMPAARETARSQPPSQPQPQPQRQAAPPGPAPAVVQAPPPRQAAPAQPQPREESPRAQRPQQRDGNARPGAPPS